MFQIEMLVAWNTAFSPVVSFTDMCVTLFLYLMCRSATDLKPSGKLKMFSYFANK